MSKEKFIVIELSDENDTLPKVFYEGKELKYLSRIHLDWKTKSDQPGRLDVNVEYYELDENGIPILKGIGIDKCI